MFSEEDARRMQARVEQGSKKKEHREVPVGDSVEKQLYYTGSQVQYESLALRLYEGEFLTDDEMIELGFRKVDIRVMGAVRTTKNIAVMPLAKMKSEANKRAKMRWLAYCEYKDALRRELGAGLQFTRLDWVAEIKMPVSWKAKDKISMIHTIHDQKPDKDNIEKGIMDAVMKEDKAVGIGFNVKWWSDRDVLWVRVR